MRKLYVSIGAYLIGIFAFTLLSFSLTDPNLVLSNNEWYWQFQIYMWRTFFDNPPFQGKVFSLLFLYIVSSYIYLMYVCKKIENIPKKIIYFLITATTALLFVSYNALSHDIFNYIFNAKMVLVYNLDPHVHTAIEKSYDDWVRFMHNVHTPAPYGYGWTAFSLLPSFFGFGKFLLTLFNFKLVSLLSYLVLARTALKNKNNTTTLLLLLNPLILIEVISSGHNDLFMMLPAMFALTLVINKKTFKDYVLAGLLLLLSISIKFATLTLIPLVAAVLVGKHLKLFKNLFIKINLERYWPLYASLLSFIPLLTERSQYFHPWYLIWPLVWIIYFPQAKGFKSIFTYWQYALITLSFSSLFRYIPWISAGGFSQTVIEQQIMVTWIPLILYTFAYSIYLIVTSHSKKT